MHCLLSRHPTPAGDHRTYQFNLSQVLDDKDRRHVDKGGDPEDMCGQSVHALEEIVTEQRIDFFMEKTGTHQDGYKRKHQVDHSCPQRVVTGIFRFPALRQLPQMLADRRGGYREIGEARMLGAYEPPNYAHRHSRCGCVAEPNVDIASRFS